jgi:multiple sugar transport system substrate-binding protein
MLEAATNSALSFSILRPEMTYRLARYPTVERDLYQRKFEKHDTAPVFGLPWSCPAELLVFRADLLDGAFARVLPQVAEFYNTEVAPNWTNSWRMFTSAARLLQLVHKDVRPLAARGATTPDAVIEDFLPILWSFGGELWNEERRKADGVLNNTTAVKALQYYCEWNSKSKIIPPDAVQWANADACKALADGKVAMGITWPHLAQRLQDDKQSRAAGRISVASLPGDVAISVQAKPSKDPGGAVTGAIDAFQAETTIRRCTLSGGAGIGISVHSKQKPAAWQYLEWLFSREVQTKLIFEPGLNYFSARKDLKAESRSASPVNRVVMEAFDGGCVRSSWNIPEAPQLDAILARECSLALRGTKTPREALDAAAKEIQFILDRGGSK